MTKSQLIETVMEKLGGLFSKKDTELIVNTLFEKSNISHSNIWLGLQALTYHKIKF